MGIPAPSRAAGPLDLCTIVARNYLPYARVLADSFHEHHPGARCHVLVLDGPVGADSPDHMRIWTADEVGIEGLAEMAASYEVTELATAVKPAFLRRLLNETEQILYLDPDIRIYAPLTPVTDALERAPIVLNPHLTQPLPDDGESPDDQDILLAGAYNLGFIALAAGDPAERLLDWWARHLRDDCRIDIPAGLFVDQRWIDLVPGLFPTTLVTDPGCNVAYWNLPHRRVAGAGADVRVDGVPLRFFHFSGFDPSRPHKLSKHQTRPLVAEQPDLRALLAAYAAEVARATGPEASAPYGYERLPNGMTLTYVVRAGHRRWRREGSEGDVWTDAGAETFAAWLGAQQPGAGPGVSRYLHELHAARRDLRDTFELDDATGAERYLLWVRERGRVEVEIPERFLPALPPGTSNTVSTGRRWAHVARHSAHRAVQRATLRRTRR